MADIESEEKKPEEKEPEEKEPEEKEPEDEKKIITHFVTALLWTTALTLIFAFLLERIVPAQVEQMKASAYTRLSDSLAQKQGSEDPPVSVVDISGLTPQRVSRPDKVLYVTPREDMQKFLTMIIKNVDTRPYAVGIDVDFSPDMVTGLSDPNDPQFFAFCERMKKVYHVPIYLGVARRAGDPPGKWLLPQFSDLAANIAVPRGDKKYLPAQIGSSSAPVTGALPSMGVALGTARAGYPPVRLHGIFQVFQPYSLDEDNKELDNAFHTTNFLVDYSTLKDIQNRARPIGDFTSRPSDREKAYLFHKIVLLGNDNPDESSDENDMQTFPGERHAPGVYLHACAAATLVSGPLYELTFWGAMLLDFSLAFLLISVYTLARLWLFRQDKMLKVELSVLFALLAALVVWGAALLAQGRIIPGLHIMWLDFLLVAAAYLLHSPLEKFFGKQVSALREAIIADRATNPDKETPDKETEA